MADAWMGGCAPLALTAAEVVLNVVDGVPGSGTTLAVLGSSELLTENLVVLVMTDSVDNNVLLVIGDLVDDVLGLALAQTELVECRQALVLDGNTANRKINMKSCGGEEAISLLTVEGRGRSYPDASWTTNQVSI